MSTLNKQHIQRQFDQSALRYDYVAQMQREIVEHLSKLVLLEGEPPKKLVDAGCGTGYGLKALMALFPGTESVGLDLAQAMLDVTHKEVPHAVLVQGDMEQMPFDDQSFDLSWTSSAIQWCDLDLALSELVRVTKPGGQLMVSTFCHGTLQWWRDVWGLDSSTQRFLSVDAIEYALRSTNLKEVVVTRKTFYQRFTSFSSAVASIRDLGAGNAERSRRKGLLGVTQYRAIKEKCEDVIERDGCLSLPYDVVFITARRHERSS